jgi:hypothetical protein
MQTCHNVALLAPVPLEHLVDGRLVAQQMGHVAFGSRVFELFRQLDALRNGLPADVYIYPSHAGGPRVCEVSWQGVYLRSVESSDGAHPEGMKYRPPSTAKYPADNLGHWGVFWEVADLRELAPADRMSVGQFTGFGKKKPYGHSFPPEGPLLVEHP